MTRRVKRSSLGIFSIFAITATMLVAACGSVTVNCDDHDHPDKAGDMASMPTADMAAPSPDMIRPDMKPVGTFTAVHSPTSPSPIKVVSGQTNFKGDQTNWSALGANYRVTGLSFKADMAGGFDGHNWKFVDDKGTQIGTTRSTITNGVWNDMPLLYYTVTDGSKPTITTQLDIATGATGEAHLSYRVEVMNLTTSEVFSISVTGGVIQVVGIKDALIGRRTGAVTADVTAGSAVQDPVNFTASALSDILTMDFNVKVALTGGFIAKNLRFIDSTGTQIGSTVSMVVSGTAYDFIAAAPYSIRAATTAGFTLQYEVGAGVPVGATAVFTYVANGQVKETSAVFSSTPFVGKTFTVK